MAFIIKNDNYGVTSEDVMTCTDVSKLREWDIEVGLDVTNMDIQLSNADAYNDENGCLKNPTHYSKLKQARLLQVALQDVIKKRIVQLTDEHELYYRVACLLKEESEEEVFESFIKEAKARWNV